MPLGGGVVVVCVVHSFPLKNSFLFSFFFCFCGRERTTHKKKNTTLFESLLYSWTQTSSIVKSVVRCLSALVVVVSSSLSLYYASSTRPLSLLLSLSRESARAQKKNDDDDAFNERCCTFFFERTERGREKRFDFESYFILTRIQLGVVVV